MEKEYVRAGERDEGRRGEWVHRDGVTPCRNSATIRFWFLYTA